MDGVCIVALLVCLLGMLCIVDPNAEEETKKLIGGGSSNKKNKAKKKKKDKGNRDRSPENVD